MRSPLRTPLRALIPLAVLTACKVGPDYEPPELDVPASWEAELPAQWDAEGDVAMEWWKALNDPLLDDLVARALENNPGLYVAAARIEEVRAQRGLQLAELFPDIDAVGSVRRSRNSVNGVNSNVSGFQFDIRTLYSLGLETTWELDFWGKLRRGLEAATAEFEAGIEDWRSAVVLLQSEVVRAYVELRLAQSRIVIARSNIATQTESFRLARARFEAGLTSEADTTRAQTLMLQTEASLESLATDVVSARNRLAVLLGEFPGSLDELLRSAVVMPQLPQRIAVGIPHDLLRRRPDVRGAERRLAAQTARIGLAKGELLPSFSLSGSFSYESSSSGSLFESDSEAFSIGPFLRWNILEFGRVLRAIDFEKARTERFLHQYEEIVLRAAEEVELGLNALANEEARFQKLAQARAQSQRSADILRIEYEEGLADYQSVLDAERTRFQIEDEVELARASTLTRMISLFEALGGGWRLPAPPPVPPPAP